MRTISIKEGQKITPLKDLVAFTWIKPKSKMGLITPENYYDLGYREGRFYLGRIIATGKNVEFLKTKQIILVHEYGVKNFEGGWQEDQIYFIEEKNCKAIAENISGGLLEIQRIITKEIAKDLSDA